MILLLAIACSRGGALQFDGHDDYAVVRGEGGRAVEGLDGDALSIEAWVRRTSPSNDRPDILARRAPSGHNDSFLFRVRLDMGGVLEYGIAAAGREWGTAGKRPIPLDVWTFVAVTHDRRSGRVAFYVDGQPDASQIAPFGPARDAAMPMWLGGDPYRGPTGRPWAGQIAAVWVWGAVRSPEEVAGDYAVPPPAGASDLLFRWTGEGDDRLQLGAEAGSDASDPVRVTSPGMPPR